MGDARMIRGRPRHVLYVTGTRADFGLMRHALERIHKTRGLRLSILATGMHLSRRYGRTISEVEASGLPISGRLRTLETADTGAAQAAGVGRCLSGVAKAMQAARPDIVLLLGDRGEMLAGALAALHMNIAVAHVHGGDVSGTVDDYVRHAISKLSHLHFPATEGSVKRLRRMGEPASRIHLVGAPGLDDIQGALLSGQDDMKRRYGLDPRMPYLMLLQHPVTQEMHLAGKQFEASLGAALSFGIPVLVGEPNSDAGRSLMMAQLGRIRQHPLCRTFKNIPRADYLNLLAGTKALVGNSSSGIIEAASLKIPVVNIGTRQSGRERGANVIDVPSEREAIERGLKRALFDRRFLATAHSCKNPYGRGDAGSMIAAILSRIELGPRLLDKRLDIH